jgi:hypothetical protein
MTGELRDLRWPVVVVFSSAALSALVLLDAGGPLRLVLALWFLLICTGMSFVPLFPIPAPATRLVAAVAASLAIDTIVVTTIVRTGGLSATSGLRVLVVVCLAGCALQLRRSMRRC